jgi:hydrogenase nickel insertion protein HypA
MHESSLAKQILNLVVERAALEQAFRVVAIHGWIAESEALSPDSISFHFHALAKGTVAEDAELHLTVNRVEARCRSCLKTYLPEHHLLLCPACSSTDGELLGPTGLAIQAMDIETEA